ncbi:MAG TPA: hypothetical protein VGD99_19900 [Anaerolineae bacterium]|jgi:hypothetical protein
MHNSTIDIIPTEDFWSRQANAQTETFEFTPLGMPATITANEPALLAAAHLSAGRFSRAKPHLEKPISIQLVAGAGPMEKPPADLTERLGYMGVGDWITLSAGAWGQAFANLRTRAAVLHLSPGLATATRLVSRYFIDHYLLNFILTEWAMLHASCILDPEEQRLIVMIAPHNVGKSTTALRLLRAGFIFLADGMVLLQQNGAGFQVGGYPIGEVKLRDDVLSLFPEYSGHAVRVREQRKTVIDLRAAHPEQLVDTLIEPNRIQLCFVEQAQTAHTRVTRLSPAEVIPAVAANTVYWDKPSNLAHNSAILQGLIQTAELYRLEIGIEAEGIISTLTKL